MTANMSEKCVKKLIIVGHDLSLQPIVETARQHFNVEIQLYDESEDECFESLDKESVLYVCDTFSGHIFDELMKHKKHIISPIVLQQCVDQNTPLPQPKYPLYNYFLKDAIICFSPTTKDETEMVNHFLNRIRFMSGQSRKDMKSGKSFDRTHLIESRTDTNNYRCAVIYGIPILFKEWIEELWQHRNDSHFDPNDINLINKFKIKAFHGLGLAFVGFSKENPLDVTEREDMEVLTKAFDGQVVDSYSNSCTHIILNANKGEKVDINFDHYERIPDNVVYKSWFTESVHIKNREEEEFHHYFSQKMRELCRTPSTCGKLSVNGLGVLSPDYDLSFSLDTSVSKSKLDTDVKALDQKCKSFTYHLCCEMCQTETNYVKILKDILLIFREPLLNHNEPQMVGLFPNDIELKTIFGCLPPLIEVHEEILKKLENIIQNWSEDNEIGKVFVEHSQQFLTAYPQYINYHEKTQEMINECIEKYPKFASFLKVQQRDAKCGRQTLKELLINPIQRLPRIELYLKSLLDKTPETKSDYKSLKEALNTIVEVNKRINKGKEKTEGQMKMFDIINDIEDCPPTLLSSHRHFIANCDVRLLILNEAKEITKFDNYLFTCVLFNDLLMLCKKRTLKRTNSLTQKGSTNYPNSAGIKKNSSKKSFKHIETIELSRIKYIVNDKSDEFSNCFAIITIPLANERSFSAYPFEVKTPEFDRHKFMDHISQTILQLMPDFSQENIIREQSFRELDFACSNVIARNVSKSKYAIYRTKEKINRTFSVRRQSLAPAMSLESLHVPPLQSSLPPSSPSTGRRISRMFSGFLSPKTLPNRNSSRYLSSMTSMTSLNENSDIEIDSNFSLPTTPAPRKKNKCSTNTEHISQI